MSASLASSTSAANAVPFLMISSDARHIAVPPMYVARELPWPPPVAIRSVSPWRSMIFSLGTPSWWARICGKVVSWPWPMCCVPVISDTVPSGSKRTSTFSSRRAAGALDVVGKAQPAPAGRAPRSLCGGRRSPLYRRVASANSSVSGKAPLSTWKPNALVIGMSRAGTMFSRRSSTRSMPHCSAAASIRRSRMFTVSAKPGRASRRSAWCC